MPKKHELRLVFHLERSGSSSLYKPEYFYGKGLGGGECALHLLTRQLAKMGHRVEIYNNVGDGQKHDGVWHYHHNQFNPQDYHDAFILFRSPGPFLYGHLNTPVKLFWSVDQQTQGNYATDIFPYVDYSITISPYHTNYHIARYRADPYKIGHIDLGVNLGDYKQDIRKVPGRLIYTSVEARGLWYLPALYREIKKIRPEVSLVITGDYTLWGARFTGLEQAPQRFAGLDDVEIMGAVPREELVLEQLKADILALPNPYEELFCLAAAEAQVAGAIPVTTDIGALKTTVMTGYVIPSHPGVPQYQRMFVDLIVGLLSERTELKRLQAEAREKAIERFSYERIAEQWISLIGKLQKGTKIKMAKKQCQYEQDGKQCTRTFAGQGLYCWQHKEVMAKQRVHFKGPLSPTDLVHRITRSGRIVHLRCHGHTNILETQLGQFDNLVCVAGDDPGEIDADTSIILLDVLPCWGLEQAQKYIGRWAKAGAEIIAFLPLKFAAFARFGQVRMWAQEELEGLGFQVEVLPGFHNVPGGPVDAAWAIIN